MEWRLLSLRLRNCSSLPFFTCFLLIRLIPSSASPPIGIHPLDEKYYDSDVIKCKDGSKSFGRERLNDNFCDCPDGTDEPGTSACPTGKFYCKNVGSMPQFLFSSRVNDHFCDCCDGSDEYDGGVICYNTCVMGGNVAYEALNYGSTVDNDFDDVKIKGIYLEDSTQKLTGLKLVIILQAVLILFLVVFRLSRWRARSRRRHP
ncbi:hypothetical protein NMG60_11032817 [Bertholletia excelsa]